MEQDEIEPRARFLRHVVAPMRAMIEKTAQELSSFRIGGAGRIRATHASLGQGAHNGVDGVVVKLEEFVLRALPVADVGLIPNFPEPSFYLCVAVSCAKMADELKDEFGPLLIILWRIGPAGENGALRKIVAVGLRMSGKRFGHKSNFDQGLDSSGMKGIENAI